MASCGNLFVAIGFIGVVIADSLTQSDTCDAIRQFTQGSVICSSLPKCCTRFLCSLNIPLAGGMFMSDFQVNPCSSPPSLSALITAGDSVLLNQTDISTTQHVPINYFGRSLGADLVLLVNSTEDSLTFMVHIGDIEVIPETTIPINTTQCSSNSAQPPDICFPTPVTDTDPNVVPSPPPSSLPTCQALQQVASRNSLGMNTNDCVVSNGCTRLSCTYLNLFPFSVTILPCNSPPAVEFSINNTDGTVLVDETVSRTRVISLEDLAPDSNIYITINHPCGRSAIVVEVALHWLQHNSTIFPPTEIPINQSNCSSVTTTSYPCTTPPAPPTSTCDALQLASRTSGSICYTGAGSDCSSVSCDLNPFSLPLKSNLTVLPCLTVPGVRLVVTNNRSIVLDEVLTQSRSETVNVGPANVSLNVIVLQSTDMSSIEIEVEVVVPGSPVHIPIVPLSLIPLDRCSCPQINCSTPSSDSQPIQSTEQDISLTSHTLRPVAMTTTLLPQGPTQQSSRATPSLTNSSSSQVVVTTVIAVLLFVGLVMVITGAAVTFLIMRRRHNAYRKNFDNMAYSYVKTRDGEVDNVY